MLKKLRPRLTYADVMATPPASSPSAETATAAHLAVNGADVADESLTGAADAADRGR